MAQVNWSTLIEQLRSTTPSKIRSFVSRLESKIPANVRTKYQKLVRSWLRLAAISWYTECGSSQEPLCSVIRASHERDIPLTLLARYIVVTTYIIPLIHLKEHTKQWEQHLAICDEFERSYETLKRSFLQLPEVKTESAYDTLLEGILSRIWQKIKSIIWKGISAFGKALLLTAATLVETYQTVFSILGLPFKYAAELIPFGNLLVRHSIRLFLMSTNATLTLPIFAVHRFLMSPLVTTGAAIVRDLVSGQFWERLEEMTEDLMREIDVDDIDSMKATT